jgi:hypothetical protein
MSNKKSMLQQNYLTLLLLRDSGNTIEWSEVNIHHQYNLESLRAMMVVVLKRSANTSGLVDLLQMYFNETPFGIDFSD